MQLGVIFNAIFLGVSTSPEFLYFVDKYNKTYETADEFQKASDIFDYNSQSIFLHPYSFQLDINEFADVHPYHFNCLLYTSPSPRDLSTSRMPSSA